MSNTQDKPRRVSERRMTRADRTVTRSIVVDVSVVFCAKSAIPQDIDDALCDAITLDHSLTGVESATWSSQVRE